MEEISEEILEVYEPEKISQLRKAKHLKDWVTLRENLLKRKQDLLNVPDHLFLK